MAEVDFDSQLRKAFQDLQSQIVENREKQKNAEAMKNAMKQNIRIASVVKGQLELIPRDRTVYRTVGRIFLQETVDSEIERQAKDVQQATERIATIDKQKEYLEKSVQESEKNLRILGDQSHILTYWNELSDSEKKSLGEQVKKLDVSTMNNAFKETLKPKTILNLNEVSRVSEDRCVDRSSLTPKERENLFSKGLKAISQGQVAAIVLAGGQASRLGADKPKGVLKLGININSKTDSLFYIQACRIVHLLELAKNAYPDSKPSMPWLIMTSKSTFADTKEHIAEVIEETGLKKEDTKSTIATAPDGNGGIFFAIRPLLTILKERGVKHTHVYCVDNVLVKVADPYMIGACIEKEADCAAKVIEKTQPNEAVGVVLKGKNGRVCVVEYSEIPKEAAEKRDDNGKLYFRAGSIANHYFSLDFLKVVCANLSFLPYHVARKKIPHIDMKTGELVVPQQPNGIKLEQFIFDSFYYSQQFLIWQVPKESEFSPLKNPNSAGVDCINT
uniref:UDP-N-acetylglucosamine diphosphorylase n=1 Tax=Ditylenchus dipsaci TaxID=166011 RepID=A0A915DK35_9BILA